MSEAPYEILGGADGLRALVDRFYDLMDELQEAETIRALHAPDLTEAREKLFLFLSGWTGGPSLYIEKYGHPRLRARHLPFPIGGHILCIQTPVRRGGPADSGGSPGNFCDGSFSLDVNAFGAGLYNPPFPTYNPAAYLRTPGQQINVQ